MRVDNISPSENISWVYNWVAGVDGEYSFVFDVDVEKSVLETSEDNNSDILVIVSETPFPVLPVGGILAVIILLGLYVWRYGPIVRLNNENEDLV